MLLKALLMFLPVVALLAYSTRTFARTRATWSLLLTGGSVCFVIVILTHVAEALHMLPMMGWGEPHSVGHYIDLSSAVGGVILLACGVFARIRAKIGIFQPDPNTK